jgi:autotransporter-associated beta strand protein
MTVFWKTLPLVLAATGVMSGVVRAQVSGTWAVDADGNWSTPANWSSNPQFPSSGGVATFGTVATAPRTITLNVGVTLGGVTFDGANGYTIGGVSTMTLNGTRRLDAASGLHTINTPLAGTSGLDKRGNGTLVLGGNSSLTGNISVNAGMLRLTSSTAIGPLNGTNAIAAAFGGRVELDNSINLGNRNVGLATSFAQAPAGAIRSLSGDNQIGGNLFFLAATSIGVDAGTLTHAGQIIDNGVAGSGGFTKVGGGTFVTARLGGGPFGSSGASQPISVVNVAAGTVRVSPIATTDAVGRVRQLDIAAGATLDVTSSSLLIDYAATSPQPDIREHARLGRLIASGLPAGVGVAYAELASLLPAPLPATYLGQPVDATTLLIQPRLIGDANFDGTVGFGDLLAVAQNYGAAGSAVWLEGDFTYDAAVGFSDLLAVAQNYGATQLSDGRITTDAAMADAFDSDWRLARAIVPEPAALSASIGLALCMRRRRR